MDIYFELFLKGICTVFILYITFNTIFRYHTTFSIIDFTLVLSLMIVSFFFIGHYLVVIYISVIGALIVLYIAVRFYMTIKKIDVRIAYSISKRESEKLKLALENAKTSVSSGEVKNYRNLSFIIITKNLSKTQHKDFIKSLDKEISLIPIHFGYFQYFNIAIALILMASIWRF